MKHRALIVGGANGIGLAIATLMARDPQTERVYIVDKAPLNPVHALPGMEAFQFDLTAEDYSFFDRFDDIDTLMITAGFGRLTLFRDVDEHMIPASFAVNTIPPMRLIHRFYHRLESTSPFRCGIMVSIAGFMSSPFFSVYAATKAALKVFIESVNVELEQAGTDNRILNVSPGNIRGTSFEGGQTDLSQVEPLAADIIAHLDRHSDLFIPHYDDVFHNVLERYHADFRAEGRHSYEYKVERMRKESEKRKSEE